jgi:serine-type D-Ala-D-Ala carboxypeptidase (penicillin-binding protein 5/6)
LLPSGNNLATLLARWDASSEAVFVAKMNAQARALHLAHTRYVDASGLSAGTASTARDQVSLAMVALEVAVLRQIVAMRQATLPVAGRQYNLNAMLGNDGIVEVKTGSTSHARGCFDSPRTSGSTGRL